MARPRQIRGLKPDDSFEHVAQRIVAVRADELFSFAKGVLNVDDIERLHDMRVATRRLRAVLEVFANCFPRRAHRRVLDEVKVLADALGERRDHDVQIASLETYAAAAPAPDRPGVEALIDVLRVEQQEANAALAIALERVDRGGLRKRLTELTKVAA
jgi:CHAD domain-containing protein